MTPVAAITIAHGRHSHLRRQQESLAGSRRPPDVHILVAMDDPVVAAWPDRAEFAVRTLTVPTDRRGLPLAAARNAGAMAALAAGAGVLVFLDVDCLAGRDLVTSYARATAERPDVIWSGPVTYLPPASPDGYELDRLDEVDAPHPARPAPALGQREVDAAPDLFWSLSFAMSPTAWRQVGGFCEEYVGYGGEDTDFAYTAASRGVQLGWDGGARAYHQHHSTSDPPVQHLDDILRNVRIFRDRWGRWPMTGWLRDFERAGLVRCVHGQWSRV